MQIHDNIMTHLGEEFVPKSIIHNTIAIFFPHPFGSMLSYLLNELPLFIFKQMKHPSITNGYISPIDLSVELRVTVRLWAAESPPRSAINMSLSHSPATAFVYK
jgi:hypothetical protein